MYRRINAAGAVIRKKFLWITGSTKRLNWSDTEYPLWLTYYFGFSLHQVREPLPTSEIFNSDTKAITSGPILPVLISHHSVIELGQNEFLLIGGHQDGKISNNTWKVQIENNFNFLFSKGPNMVEKRAKHSCAKMKINGSIYVVAVGGYHRKSIELLNISHANGQNWFKGNAYLKSYTYIKNKIFLKKSSLFRSFPT